MKKKQKEEIRSKGVDGLVVEVGKKQEEIYRLRLEIKTGKVKNTSELKEKTDELAVIKTILQEKKFSQN